MKDLKIKKVVAKNERERVLTYIVTDINGMVISPKSVVNPRVPATVSTYNVVSSRNRKRRECEEEKEEEEEET